MNRVAFILDQFELSSPAQQLLDRFLIGYKQGGEFKAIPAKVLAILPNAREHRLLQARAKDFGLETLDTLDAAAGALGQIDAALFAPGTRASAPSSSLKSSLDRAIGLLPAGKTVYLDASLLSTVDADALRRAAASRSLTVLSSRAAAHLVPLPVRPTFEAGAVRQALIVVQGAFPEAELDALHALKPYLGPQNKAPQARSLKGTALWNLAYSTAWRPLLEAAISRSDNIKGDPDRDGRTQDVVGLQLLERRASEARGHTLDYSTGLRVMILVLDGAVADCNFAVNASGKIHSAQLYHPQAPMENHYDDLAAWILERGNRRSGNLDEAVVIRDIVRTLGA